MRIESPGRLAAALFVVSAFLFGLAYAGPARLAAAFRPASGSTAIAAPAAATGAPAARPTAKATTVPAAGAAAPSVAALAPDWPVYHFDSGRSGEYPSFPAFGGTLTPGWSTALDGAVYAEPLVVHGTIIAATENDSVYAINPASGAIQWRQTLGTPVPLSTLPCGNISPLGITGTPAYDPATGSIFAVAEVTGPAHILFALDSVTGAVRWSRSIDLAGEDPTTHQQRPALAVANGYVYIGLGGLSGDCGQYIGEEIGVPVDGVGATISYRVPTTREGAIWATGGPVVDATGNLYVSVGNGASTTTYDGTDSVLELSPTLALLSRFAPSVWAADNAGDADLGSLSPVLLPGGWVFIAGKNGHGYSLHQGALGGIGGQVSSASVCAAFGGAAFSGDTVYVPCVGSIRQVQIGSNGAVTAGWQSSAAGGPPVIGGGVVWSVSSSGRLVALNPATGATIGSISVGAVPHFASPTLWQSQILVGTMAGISSTSVSAAATYHPIAPTRLLDTRNGTGLSGAFSSQVARTFKVTGAVVPSGAAAVTGNLTVTQQTSFGYLAIGPVALNQPATSTLNFPLSDDRANAVTVALGAGGTLSVTYVTGALGPTAQVVFDVTGYFTPDTSGATYHGVTPTRILDTRNGIGGLSGPFVSNLARIFTVAGGGGVVPANAVAVTGNVTVTGQTDAGFLSVGPAAANSPTTSTLNFPAGDDRANAVTVALGAGGTLSITYVAVTPGGTAGVVVDVTGYFTADATGSSYVPIFPTRLLDSRYGVGLSGPLATGLARTFQISGVAVPTGASAVTGNLTVTQQTSPGFLSLGSNPVNNPTTSTLNFPLADDRANAATVALGAGGTLSVTYATSTPGQTTQSIFDVTGYFTP